MFARSAASDTLQGKAMQRVNERWGSDALGRSGRESLGMAVCKKKYTPFCFPTSPDGVTVAERRYGCRAHHDLRLQVIAQHGEREGWEPFGQWSWKKAQELARKATNKRLRKYNNAASASTEGETTTEDEVSLSSAEEMAAAAAAATAGSMVCDTGLCARENNFRSLCWNGNCLIKHPSMYDDIQEECKATVRANNEKAVREARFSATLEEEDLHVTKAQQRPSKRSRSKAMTTIVSFKRSNSGSSR